MKKAKLAITKEKFSRIIFSKYFRFCFILAGFICLMVLRQSSKTFGVSLGYIYLVLISLTGFWFGLKGGLISAIFAGAIFLLEVEMHPYWPARDLVLRGAAFRLSAYLLSGFILGYVSELQKKLSQEMEYSAYHDKLTGCVNYTWIVEFLEKEIARSRRFIKEFSIILIDIDHFKSINDTYGHLVGNDALAAFAKVIKDNLRNMDIVGRYGGEEFLIILPELGSNGALEVLERIRSKLSEARITSRHLKEGINISLQFSAGLASFPYNANNAGDLIKLADDLLYQAKQKGRDKVLVERRRCIRLKSTKGLKVEIFRLSDKEKLKIISIENISERGILLLFSQDFTEEEFLCRISLPGQDFTPEFTCNVAYKNKLENGVYRAGIYFVDIPTYTRGTLFHFVHQGES
ncbi:MAG: GGDEF domain-containing protein [Candidatus Omnitrophica bacterium]|nr:GGDEF domain-containing protein [Candidatus Omnitrophota bacterium]